MLKGQKIMILYAFGLMIFGAVVFIVCLAVWLYDPPYGELKDYHPLRYDIVNVIAWIMGGIMLLAGLIYCIVMKEDICMLITFQLVLISIFVVMIIVGVFASWFCSHCPMADAFQNALAKSDPPQVNSPVDAVQRKFQCCGYNGPSDYRIDYPSSCCKNSTNCTYKQVHEKDCKTEIVKPFRFFCVAIAVIGFLAALYAVVGVAMIVIGVLAENKNVFLALLFTEQYWDNITVGLVLCLIGGMVIVMGLCGFCGALLYDGRLIWSYQGMLLLLFVLEVVIGVLCLWFRLISTSVITKRFEGMVKDYPRRNNSPSDLLLLQDKFECCGFRSPHDFPLKDFPPSCCKVKADSCYAGSPYSHSDGCAGHLEDAANMYIIVIGVAHLIVSAYTAIGIVLSTVVLKCVSKKINKTQNQHNEEQS